MKTLMEVSCVSVKITFKVMDSTALLYVRMGSNCQEETDPHAVSVILTHFYISTYKGNSTL